MTLGAGLGGTALGGGVETPPAAAAGALGGACDGGPDEVGVVGGGWDGGADEGIDAAGVVGGE